MTSKKMTDFVIVMLIILSVAIPASITFRQPIQDFFGDDTPAEEPSTPEATSPTEPSTTTTTNPASVTVVVDDPAPVQSSVPSSNLPTPSNPTPQPTTPPTSPGIAPPPPPPTDPPADEPVEDVVQEVTELVDEVVDETLGCDGILVILC